MDDLLQKMQDLLSSKEGQEQIKSMAEMFSMGDASEEIQKLGDMFSGNSSDTSSSQESQKDDKPESGQSEPSILDMLNGIDMNTILTVQKILGNMNREDDDTRLLLALKPHFKKERQDKVDKAVKMLKLLALLPLIKESGLLGGLFSDAGK